MRFSAPVRTGTGAHPAYTYIGYRVYFPGVKRPGRGADPPPPSKRRGHERVGLYLYSPSGSSWPVIGRAFTFILPLLILETRTVQPGACHCGLKRTVRDTITQLHVLPTLKKIPLCHQTPPKKDVYYLLISQRDIL